MTFILRTACTIALAFGICGTLSAQESTLAQGDLIQDSMVELASCSSCDTCGDTSCGGCSNGGCSDGGLDLGLGDLGSRNGQVFVGAEYLSIRSNFSEATAYIETDTVANTSTWEQFESDYSSSFRVYAGYRLCDCGGEIRFTYTNFDTDGGFDSGPLDTVGGTIARTPPLELIANQTGDRIVGDSNVSVDNFDLGFSKTIPLGSPLSSDTCCGDTCGGCCDTDCCTSCPAWDITWTGALRVASVDSNLNYRTIADQSNSTPTVERSANISTSFDGVGMRTGLLGRRYIGKSGIASVYLKGDISLLLGEVEHSAESTATSRNQITSTQVVPVTEIEAGGTVYLLPNLSVSGGYMLAAWHDLGNRAEYDFSGTGAEVTSMDDANLLTFDGFFLRAEAAF